MRAIFWWSVLEVLLCSCGRSVQPEISTSAVTSAPVAQPTLTRGTKFNLGDGWSVQILSIDNDLTMCRAGLDQSSPPVSLFVYYLGDTGKPNPILQLSLVTPQRLTGPVTYPNLFVVRIDGEEAAAVDPDASQIQQGMAFLTTAIEMGQTLASKFARAGTLEVFRTDQAVTSFQSIVTVAIPHASALLRSLIACEQSGLSEAATRAAYNRGP